MFSKLLKCCSQLGAVALSMSVSACGDSDTENAPADGPADAGVRVEPAPIEQASPNQLGTLIETVEGPVQGKIAGATRAFLGIPYSAPPVGPLRWKPPQPVERWSEPHDATAFGAACPQGAVILPAGVAPPFAQDESCLFLNVWTPERLPSEPAPVMVWIPGGGFFGGTSQGVEFSTSVDEVPYYDGQSLVERSGVVLVSMNYRVGALGFLAHPALAGEDPEHPASGNYGIEDQREVLEWVQRNIVAFGGDPNNVTLFGESAGGSSVCFHLVSPPSRGLFHRAISESGGCRLQTDMAQAQELAAELAAQHGCTDATTTLDCLRSVDAQTLVDAELAGGLRWVPTEDGLNFPKPPRELLADGNVAPVPVIAGTNKDEGTLFSSFGAAGVTTPEDYEARVRSEYGELAERILELYPASAYPAPSDALADITGDQGFVCPTRQMVRATSAAGAPTYLYTFTYDDWSLGGLLGAFHGSEIRFIFNNPLLGLPVTTEEKPLLDAMSGYWTRMAHNGDPNGDGAPEWPAYAPESDSHIELDLGAIAAGSGLKREKCDFWDTAVDTTSGF